MSDTPLRAGIAGAGMIARVHADAIRRAGGRIVGVAASSPQRAQAAAGALGAERGFADTRSLVTDEDVEVVHICTPNHLHRPLAELALRAGKHVVCEKPLATSGDDAHALAALARQHDTVTAVPFVYRYHPMAAEARAQARSGALGAVRLIHGHYLQDWLSQPTDSNWRVDEALGGPSRAFADIGSHWCDMIEWVAGHRITELVAMTATFMGERAAGDAHSFADEDTSSSSAAPRPARQVSTEDAAQVLFRTDRGAAGALVVSQVSPGRKNRLWFEVDGAEASVTFDQENPESLLVGHRRVTRVMARDAAILSEEAARLSVLPPGHPMGYFDCFAGFVRDVYAAIRATPAPAGAQTYPATYPTFADAARAAALTDAVRASARNRSWEKVA